MDVKWRERVERTSGARWSGVVWSDLESCGATTHVSHACKRGQRDRVSSRRSGLVQRTIGRQSRASTLTHSADALTHSLAHPVPHSPTPARTHAGREDGGESGSVRAAVAAASEGRMVALGLPLLLLLPRNASSSSSSSSSLTHTHSRGAHSQHPLTQLQTPTRRQRSLARSLAPSVPRAS